MPFGILVVVQLNTERCEKVPDVKDQDTVSNAEWREASDSTPAPLCDDDVK